MPVGAARSALAASALAVALTACPGVMRPLEEPVLELQAVTITSVTPAGLDARIDLVLTNTNSIALPLRAVDWELALGGASGLRGRTDLTDDIPANGSAPVAVALHLDAASAADMMRGLAAGDTTYHVTGMLHFETALGDLAVPFDEEGDAGDVNQPPAP